MNNILIVKLLLGVKSKSNDCKQKFNKWLKINN